MSECVLLSGVIAGAIMMSHLYLALTLEGEWRKASMVAMRVSIPLAIIVVLLFKASCST